ncbi:MAG: hypothetical protein RL334_631 [Chloroflexota bacterium]
MLAGRRVATGLLPLGLALLWAGYFGPWIPHAAAALSLNALDLSEWVTYLPQVRSGALAVGRLNFLAPLSFAIVLSSAWAWQLPRTRALLLVPLLGFGVLAEPFLLYRNEPELQSQMWILFATAGGCVLGAVLRGQRWYWAGFALLAAGGLAANSWPLLLVRPIAGALYGALPGLGWGWGSTQLGAVLLVAGAALRQRSSAGSAPSSSHGA